MRDCTSYSTIAHLAEDITPSRLGHALRERGFPHRKFLLLPSAGFAIVEDLACVIASHAARSKSDMKRNRRSARASPACAARANPVAPCFATRFRVTTSEHF